MIECPHCKHPGDPYDQQEEREEKCTKCKKYFDVQCTWIPHYESMFPKVMEAE